VPYLPKALLLQTLETVCAIDETWDDEWLEVLLQRLIPLASVKEIIASVRMIGAEADQSHMLVLLADQLARSDTGAIFGEVLPAAQSIENEGLRVRALTRLVQYVPTTIQFTLVAEIFQGLPAIEDELEQGWALEAIAPYLPPSFLDQAVGCALAIASEVGQDIAIGGLAPYMPERLVTDTVRRMLEQSVRPHALVRLSPYLPNDLRYEALLAAVHAATQRLEEQTHWIEDKINPLPSGLDDRARDFAELAPLLPEPLLREALNAAQKLEVEHWRVEAVIGLAPSLSEPLLHEAFDAICAVQNEQLRVQGITKLAPYYSPELRSKALDSSATIEDENLRIKLLVELGKHIPEDERPRVLAEALAIAQTIEIEPWRADALAQLCPYLPAELVAEAFAIAQAIAPADARLSSLTPIIARLPDDQQIATLTALLNDICCLNDEQDRTALLAKLAPQLGRLPRTVLYPHWCKALHILSAARRAQLLANLEALAPLIAALGGQTAMTATAQAIVEQGSWFT
jgi:hypothetical protein